MYKDNGKFFGLSNDYVFGDVMENKDNILLVLNTILPTLHIKNIKYATTQKQINSVDFHSKDVRLDLQVEDEKGKIYDVEMQTSKNGYLPQRVRYYQSKIDSKLTLDKNESYDKLRDSIIIFICTFDPFGYGDLQYERQIYLKGHLKEEERIIDGSDVYFINATANTNNASSMMKDLIKLVNNKQVDKSSKYYSMQERVREINADPERRAKIMSLEEKIRDREVTARLEGKVEGRIEGKAEGKIEDIYSLIKRLKKLNIDSETIASSVHEDYDSELPLSTINKILDKEL